MTPDELSALFDLDLDQRATDTTEPPVDSKRLSYLKFQRLAIQRGYTPDWADRTYMDCYGVAYSSS